ncbi:MAG: endonuclease/exonuclease/phosphatase family protein [Phycisphaerae bacterium]|nr:endonuclease/exonuclease/phosphatase family protein [Phycisphaerae bacterium]
MDCSYLRPFAFLGLICFTAATFAGCSSVPEENVAPEKPPLKVVSYNINWGMPDRQKVIEFLAEADADVICLQETHRDWANVLINQLQGRYPYYVFEEWGGAGGIAIMSKYELQKVRLVKPEVGWFPALLAEVQTPIGAIQFVNVHLRPPLGENGALSLSALHKAPQMRLKEIQQFMAEVDRDKATVVVGDFNENEEGMAVGWLIDQGFIDSLSRYDKSSPTWN